MTVAEQQRIDTLTDLVTEALAEPAETPEVTAWKQRFLKFPPAGQRRIVAALMLHDAVEMLKAGAKADEAFNVEVNAAKKWAREMGRAARKHGYGREGA